MIARAGRLNQWILSAVLLLAMLFGIQPLSDPDLGTHLATGLWVLETHRVPTRDPFGAQGNFALSYSWLAEILMGAAYQVGGFVGVKVLSLFFFVATAGCVIGLVQCLSATPVSGRQGRNYPGEWLSIAVVLPLILPACQPRPQVISWIFFAILIACAGRNRLHAKYLVPLTIVWANIHVFWLLVPLMVLLHASVFPEVSDLRSRARGAAMTAGYLSLGLVNPYTWRAFAGIWEYLFGHHAADTLIAEFRPFGVLQYTHCWAFVLILLIAAVCARSLLRRERAAQLAVFLIFALAAINRIKYLPLFALSATPILQTAWRRLLPRFEGSIDAPRDRVVRTMAPGWIAVLIATGVIVAGPVLVKLQPLLFGPQRELLQIAEHLEHEYPVPGSGAVTVLTDYDYGGWLILAFWLARPPGVGESRFKVAIDGRTLVVGQQRILEYNTIVSMGDGWRDIFASWNPEVAILPSRAALVDLLLSGTDRQADSLGKWTSVYRSLMWTTLVRPRAIASG